MRRRALAMTAAALTLAAPLVAEAAIPAIDVIAARLAWARKRDRSVRFVARVTHTGERVQQWRAVTDCKRDALTFTGERPLEISAEGEVAHRLIWLASCHPQPIGSLGWLRAAIDTSSAQILAEGEEFVYRFGEKTPALSVEQRLDLIRRLDMRRDGHDWSLRTKGALEGAPSLPASISISRDGRVRWTVILSPPGDSTQ